MPNSFGRPEPRYRQIIHTNWRGTGLPAITYEGIPEPKSYPKRGYFKPQRPGNPPFMGTSKRAMRRRAKRKERESLALAL